MKLKHLLFNFTLLLVPLLLLALIEIGLRLFHYGGSLDLFTLNQSGQVTEYVLNESFTRRYFFQKGIKTPTPLSQRFPAHKAAGTLRIFCLGESTTQGFPYPPNAAYPALLGHLLSDACPDQKIEVLNCGITAVTSHCVLDIEKEILRKYQPDLLVIYTGHNEFYGVFGQASTLSPLKSRAMIQLFLNLQRFKLFLLMRDTINGVIGKTVRRHTDRSSATLMSIMAKDVGIELHSETVHRALSHYRRNLEAMCQAAAHQHIPIVLCTQVDNLRDLPPFASKHKTNFSAKDSLQWRAIMQQADGFEREGRFVDALPLLMHALEMDSTHAATRYRLGRCFYALGDLDQARLHLTAAKDFDVVRFRAPSSFNQAVINTVKKEGVPVADCAAAFAADCSGIPGNDLLHEHVHPNLRGQLLIARTIAQTLIEQRLFSGCDLNRTQADDDYFVRTQLTRLDAEVVNYTLFRLTSQWPFPPEARPTVYRRIGDERTEILAKSLVDGTNKSLVELHIDYGNELQAHGDWEQAAKEFQAALAIQPLALTYDLIGRLHLRQTEIAFRDLKDFQVAAYHFRKSEFFFTEGLRRWPDDRELNFNLGLLYLMRADYFESAARQFERVIELAPDHRNAHHFLIELYLRQRRFAEAKTWALKANQSFPDDARFCLALGVISIQENRLPEAVNYLEQAVRLGDTQKASTILAQVQNRINKSGH